VKVKRPARPVDEADWKRHLNERLRAEFLAAAEEEWRRRTGRPLTAAELAQTVRRYPGDIWPHREDSARLDGRRVSDALQHAVRPNEPASAVVSIATARIGVIVPTAKQDLERNAAAKRLARDVRIDLEEAQRWCDAWDRFAKRQHIARGPYYWHSARGWIDAQRSFERAARLSARSRAG
jgi:hypothetical protein